MNDLDPSLFQLQPQCLQTWRKAWVKFYSSWVSSSKLTATFLPLHHSSIRRIAQTRDVFRYIVAKASKARHKRTRSKKARRESSSWGYRKEQQPQERRWLILKSLVAISSWSRFEHVLTFWKFDWEVDLGSYLRLRCNISQCQSSQFTQVKTGTVRPKVFALPKTIVVLYISHYPNVANTFVQTVICNDMILISQSSTKY